MTGESEPESCCRRRGRPRVNRTLSGCQPRCYLPQCCMGEGPEIVSLLPEELELLKLIDLQGLEQEEAAAALGVSRKTAWRDLHDARRKIADALVNGKGIEVADCPRRKDGLCPRGNETVCLKAGGGTCPRSQQSPIR